MGRIRKPENKLGAYVQYPFYDVAGGTAVKGLRLWQSTSTALIRFQMCSSRGVNVPG